VKGVQAFGTVGQLVPFVLGVGGLSKVLWTKSKLLWEGRRPEKRRDDVDEGGLMNLQMHTLQERNVMKPM
jgi:hypothetical protein